MSGLERRVLAILLTGKGRGGCDEWEIASSLYPWDDSKQRRKHGAWIHAIAAAGYRLTKKGLAGSYIISHGAQGYNAPGDRIWFITKEGKITLQNTLE